jgi:hypothetical protein
MPWEHIVQGVPMRTCLDGGLQQAVFVLDTLDKVDVRLCLMSDVCYQPATTWCACGWLCKLPKLPGWHCTTDLNQNMLTVW